MRLSRRRSDFDSVSLTRLSAFAPTLKAFPLIVRKRLRETETRLVVRAESLPESAKPFPFLTTTLIGPRAGIRPAASLSVTSVLAPKARAAEPDTAWAALVCEALPAGLEPVTVQR